MKTTLQKILPILLAIILTVIIVRSCSKPDLSFTEPRYIIKKELVELNKQSDSTKQEVKKQDLIRIKYVVKWREIKSDTIFKECQELILICDTILKVDSSEIASLKALNKIDSNIITTQKIMLQNDSLDLNCYKKKLKKNKRQKALLFTGLIITAGSAILR